MTPQPRRFASRGTRGLSETRDANRRGCGVIKAQLTSEFANALRCGFSADVQLLRQLAIHRKNIGRPWKLGLHLTGARALQFFNGREGEWRFRLRIFRSLQPACEPAVRGLTARLAVAVAVIGFDPGDVIGDSESSVHLLCLFEGCTRSGNREEVANGGQHEIRLAAGSAQKVGGNQTLPQPERGKLP